MADEIDVYQPLEFLSAMWGHGPHSVCCFVKGSGFRFGFIDVPAELAAQVDVLQNLDVWIGAHPLRARPAQGRGDRDDVLEVVALPADLDWAHETRRTDQPLPSEAEVRERLGRLGPHLQPSIVVNSGHGLQPWWVLTEPLAPDEAEQLIAQLDAALADVELENGRSDLASILRLPGTRNHKGDGEQVPVVIETFSERCFPPEYLREHWPAAEASRTARGTKHQRGSVTAGQQTLCDYIVANHGGHDVDVWGDGSMHLVRPDKLAKDGSSASIIVGDDGDALLTVFSEHWPEIGPVPPETRRSWVLGTDGELHHPADPLAGIRINFTTPPPPDVQPCNLPDEFWTSRPELAALRRWAHSRQRSADAVYAAVRARMCALTPHWLTIDTGIATPMSLNSLIAVIGVTGAGKTTTAALGRELVPILGHSKDVFEGALGSGEGVAELYFEWVDQPRPSGKGTVKVRQQTKHGALLLLDEGEALTRMAERSGATIMPTLRLAYSGEMIGQTNAKQENRRIIAAGDYRFVLLVGLQDGPASTLLADSATGTPQRFVMFNANDPSIDPVGAPLPWQPPWLPPAISKNRPMTLAAEVAAEVRERDLAIQRGTLELDVLDSHHNQNRIKEASHLAIIGRRLDVSVEDWRLAGMVMDTSDAIRRWVIERSDAAGQKLENQRTDAAVRRQRATVQALSSDAHERAVDRGARAMARRAARSAPDPVSLRQLSRAVAGRDRDEAGTDEMIKRAEDNDWLRPAGDDRWVVGGSIPA